MTGVEPGVAAALIAAAGTATSIYAQQEAEDDRRATLNQQLQRTDDATKKAVNLVEDQAATYSPQSQADALAAIQAAAETRSKQDLEGAGGASIATAGDPGNVSADFITAKADRAVTEGQRLTDLGREFAKIRAPGQFEVKQGMANANLSGNLADILGTNRNMANANTLDAQSITTPAYGQVGQLASSLGAAYLASGAGSAANGANYSLASGGGASSAGGLGLRAPSQISW